MLKSIFIGLSIREDSVPFALALVVGLIVPSRILRADNLPATARRRRASCLTWAIRGYVGCRDPAGRYKCFRGNLHRALRVAPGRTGVADHDIGPAALGVRRHRMLRTVHLPLPGTGHAATGFAHNHADHCGCRAAALHFGGVPAAVWADRNVARDPASDSSHHRRSRGRRTLVAQATNARVICCGVTLAARNSVPALGPGRNPAPAARDAEQALGRIPCGPSVQSLEILLRALRQGESLR